MGETASNRANTKKVMSDIRMDYTNAPTPEAAIDSISRV